MCHAILVGQMTYYSGELNDVFDHVEINSNSDRGTATGAKKERFRFWHWHCWFSHRFCCQCWSDLGLLEARPGNSVYIRASINKLQGI